MCSEYLGRTATDTCGGEANALNEDHCPPSKQQKSGPQDCVTEGNVLNSVHGSPKQQGECDKAEASPSPQKECDQSRIDMGKLYKDVTATVSWKREVKSSPQSWNKGKKTKMEKDAQVLLENQNSSSLNIASCVTVIQVVFDWSLSDYDNNNPIVQTTLSVLHEGTAKDDDNECCGGSKAEVELEEKIQKHEMLIRR
ncbi:hypothetical protein DEO72_LG2g3642 [Vigna unguiculata]|uniref:Uncharacterized protein n=1 Tax=Vigna unguiculata TaxID=3917 RepID=A0A4D6L496_VIGUN|nr:hypothetical protein DEO72_LG2g3642 [Vigna unguiculata]